jgi:hypothetical protein
VSKFDGIMICFQPQGESGYYYVLDQDFDTIKARGSLETIQAHFYEDDCVFCDRLPGRTYGLCDGSCGAPIPSARAVGSSVL